MTDLIKELRELYAKTTQGERYITGICAGSTAIGIEGNEKAFMFLENNADAEFIVKAHNDLPKLLDELEAWKKEADDSQHKELDASYDNAKLRIELNRHKEALKQAALNVEASQKAARAYCDELDRYKKALEVCKESRNSYIEDAFSGHPTFIKDIVHCDKQLDQILEGEG